MEGDLNQLYSPSQFAKRLSADAIIAHHVDLCNKKSVLARGKIDGQLDIMYLPRDSYLLHNNPGLDLIFPNNHMEIEEASLFVFVHGGYWQECHKDMYTFVGESFANLGYTSAVVGYDLAPKVTIKEIVNECKAALVCLIKNSNFRRVFLCGHSVGAQLVCLAVLQNWHKFNIDPSAFRGIITISGVFDLRPIVNTYINDAIGLNEETAAELSPVLQLEEMKGLDLDCSFLCLVAEHECPGIQQQNEEFYRKLASIGIMVHRETVKDVDHFSIIDNISDSTHQVTRSILHFIEQ